MFKLVFLLLALLRLLPFVTGDEGESGTASEKVKPSDMLDRYSGDAVKMASRLADLQNDNFEYRRKNDALVTENKDLKAKLPAADAVVLSKDDASELAKYRELGKVDEVKDKLKVGGEATVKVTQYERHETLRKIAKVAGYKDDALADFDQLEGGLEYVEKDVTETTNGKTATVKRVFVKQGDKETALGEYVKAKRPHLEAALVATEPVVPGRVLGTPLRDENRTRIDQGNGPTITGPAIKL